MKITHVIRAEDLLPNTPKQILLQEALGFTQPEYAHLPLILSPDRSKMSKRHGATSIKEYNEEGYLSEAIINFLAFLGWNPGDDKEIFSLASLKKEFSLENVQKHGAVFNIKRLDYLNGFYIRRKPLEELTELCIPYLIKAGLIIPVFKEGRFPATFGGSFISSKFITKNRQEIDFETIKKAVFIYQERLKKLSEIAELVDFLFKEKMDYKKELLLWKDMDYNDVASSIDKSINILSKIKNWNKDSIEKELLKGTENRGELLWPLRVALSGKKASAPPFEIADVLGREKTLKRLNQAKEICQK
jgi:glutamyl/glutaminyl-tRNA synthetase